MRETFLHYDACVIDQVLLVYMRSLSLLLQHPQVNCRSITYYDLKLVPVCCRNVLPDSFRLGRGTLTNLLLVLYTMGNTFSTRWRQDSSVPPTMTQPLQPLLPRRQVHDEAASISYGNSIFICCVQKIVPAQKASVDLQYPVLPAALDWQSLPDHLNISRGVFSPAARYHRHLSHLTIYANVTIMHCATRSSTSPTPNFSLVYGESGDERASMEAMHSSVEHMMVRVYQRVKCPWRNRDDKQPRHSRANDLDLRIAVHYTI
jgi:hypothetical protein